MEYSVDEGFLQRHRIDRGHMTLVDEPRLEELLGSLRDLEPKRTSGGSAANTLIAAQAFGSPTFYSCKVGDDDTGAFFLKDLGTIGVATNRQKHTLDAKSGRCLVLITPDGERSMSTFLGISDKLDVGELDEIALRESRYLYMEGFLSSSSTAAQAAIRCREWLNTTVSNRMTLSDASMVNLFRASLLKMLGNGVDHLSATKRRLLIGRTDRLTSQSQNSKTSRVLSTSRLGRAAVSSSVVTSAGMSPVSRSNPSTRTARETSMRAHV
jgi:fructokinase